MDVSNTSNFDNYFVGFLWCNTIFSIFSDNNVVWFSYVAKKS